MRQIARELNVPEATIRARMKRLSDLGVLRIVAFVDPREFGDSQLALVELTIQPSRHDAVIHALVGMRETTYVSTVLGASDVVCEIHCADNQELWEILNSRIATIPGVLTMSTRPIVKVHKLLYGTPA